MKTKKILSRISIELMITIVLVALKMNGVIDWSWWTVTCLLWADLVIMAGTALGIYIIARIFEKHAK